MQLPDGVDEAQLFKVLDKLTKVFAKKYSFGIHTPEDCAADAQLLALEALPRYKPELGSLEHFLSVHVRNRLQNRMRDEMFRNDPPCRRCHSGDNCGENGAQCDHYRR